MNDGAEGSDDAKASAQPRNATEVDAPLIHRVAWESFKRAVAPIYSEEGIEEYRRFSSLDAIGTRMGDGSRFWVLEDGGGAGIAELREPCHLAMLFVQPEAQGRGLGSRLLMHVMERTPRPLTVSSAPGAVGFYAAHGFEATGEEQETRGIRYLPMRAKAARRAEVEEPD